MIRLGLKTLRLLQILKWTPLAPVRTWLQWPHRRQEEILERNLLPAERTLEKGEGGRERTKDGKKRRKKRKLKRKVQSEGVDV